MEALPDAELHIELESRGRVFRAVSGASDKDKQGHSLIKGAWLWESGQMSQHFELRDLKFEDAQGVPLSTDGSLRLVMWPESLSLTAALAPAVDYADGWHRGVLGNGLCDGAALGRDAR